MTKTFRTLGQNDFIILEGQDFGNVLRFEKIELNLEESEDDLVESARDFGDAPIVMDPSATYKLLRNSQAFALVKWHRHMYGGPRLL